MWIFTKDGFFSVAKDQYCEDHELMVRVRCRDDLLRLVKRLEEDWEYTKDNILEFDHSDYRFRIKIDQHAWIDYVAEAASTIDYPTVKDNICPAGDHDRHDALYGIWRTLHDWQSRING